MTTSEKFCLTWNDFKENVSSSLKDIREDFCDVTLVGDSFIKIEAHRVILAASSKTFLKLLRQSQHPQPLIYMKGIKDIHLSAIVDFMYHGEVSIVQDDLNDFLLVAEELQLKGLTGTGKQDNNIYHQSEKNKSNFIKSTPITNSQVLYRNYAKAPDMTDEENLFDLIESSGILPIYATGIKTTTNNEQLDETIKSMMHKVDGIWTCTQCGKTDKEKYNLRNHIEGKHIEGVYHGCDHCGKVFRLVCKRS